MGGAVVDGFGFSSSAKKLGVWGDGTAAQVPASATHCRINVSQQLGGNYRTLFPFHRVLAEGQAGREETCVLIELHNKEILTAEQIMELKGNRSYCL